jgi:hypothetical protein
MIMLRIPIAQPPKATRKSDMNGRNQWWSKMMRKVSDQVRWAVGS